MKSISPQTNASPAKTGRKYLIEEITRQADVANPQTHQQKTAHRLTIPRLGQYAVTNSQLQRGVVKALLGKRLAKSEVAQFISTF